MTEDFEQKVADDLDAAWVNFDPDEPLPANSPFFVEYERRPLDEFRRALLRGPRNPTQFFLAGFRGSGKSSHLNQLARDSELNERFMVVKFNIKEAADVADISVVDIIVATAAAIIGQLPKEIDAANSPMKEMVEELLAWGRRVEERVEQSGTGTLVSAEAGAEVGGGIPLLGKFFARMAARISTEATSRKTIREVLEPQLTDLIEKLNSLAKAILAMTGKPLLVLIDDTDKIDPPFTQKIFRDGFNTLTNLRFHTLYTIREFVFYSPEYPDINASGDVGSTGLLRNVKLWEKDNHGTVLPKAEDIFRQLIHKRMETRLITEDAVKKAALMSGGVFRQIATLMQIAIDHAIEQGQERVEDGDIGYAANELRKRLSRILTAEDHEDLAMVSEKHDHPDRTKITHLFLLLVVLEYENDVFWYDVNPVLWNEP